MDESFLCLADMKTDHKEFQQRNNLLFRDPTLSGKSVRVFSTTKDTVTKRKDKSMGTFMCPLEKTPLTS